MQGTCCESPHIGRRLRLLPYAQESGARRGARGIHRPLHPEAARGSTGPQGIERSLASFWETPVDDRDLGLAYAAVAGQDAGLRQRASELLRKSEALVTAPLMKTDSAEVLTRELLDNISRGLEGVVAKRLDSPYQAGARNFNWVKLKRNTSGQLNDTIDVVLLGYYKGKGKRTEFGAGALLAGVYDSDADEFVTISKLGTGLSDQGWRDIHQRLSSIEVAEKPPRVRSNLVPDVWLQPAIVVEVLADEITPSPRHTAGMTADAPGFALRFPRIVSLRTADKKAEDATSVREIREMFEQQRQRAKG